MTTISNYQLYHFISKKIGSELDAREAKALGLEKEYLDATEDLDVEELLIDEILDNNDLYEQFATLYTTEKEQKTQAKDKEQEKEEETQVKEKNNTGV